MDLIPKIQLNIILSDNNVEKAIDAIVKAARTGKEGDGIIFVYPVEDVVRIRTGERGHDAIMYAGRHRYEKGQEVGPPGAGTARCSLSQPRRLAVFSFRIARDSTVTSVVTIGLVAIAVVVTFLPLLVKKAGDNLEYFLFVMGVAAVTVTSAWSVPLLLGALQGPLKITAAVLVASLLFQFIQEPLERGITRLRGHVGPRILAASVIALVGLLSSFVTAIIASLVMVETVSRLRLDRKAETRIVVLACFSIGLGAALTPFGEPLAAVAITKLAGQPYHAATWFLMKNLWMSVIPGIALVSAAGLFVLRRPAGEEAPVPREERETFLSSIVRTAKVYIFVVGLIFLGAGFTPLINRYIGSVSYLAIFWANITSAFLDNATLTAAEIVPTMQMSQIVAALMGLLIAGGMLVPGNIPNIIAAGRLKIDSRAWAKVGVPIGMVMMVAMFAVLIVAKM